jgi:hypothetical protein
MGRSGLCLELLVSRRSSGDESSKKEGWEFKFRFKAIEWRISYFQDLAVDA